MSYIYPGIVIGALYALLGGSLTLTYSLTGVINLAVGALTYASAYLFYHLVTIDGWPLWMAAVTCGLASPAFGFLLWFLIFRNLEKKNLVVQLTATIGLAVAIPALMQLALPLDTVYQTPGILPDGFASYSWGFFNTTRDQLVAVLGAVVCIAVLVILVEKSRFGLSARAVVDRPKLAEGVGINTTRFGAVAWIIALAMTGVAGMLLSPLIQLDAAQYTTLSVAALSVALVGRFRSLTITALAGISLGVAASLITGYAPVGSVIGSGLVPALPFFLLVILLLVGRNLGGARQDAATEVTRAVWSPIEEPEGSPRARVVRRLVLLAIAAGVTAIAMFAFNDYWTGVFAAGISFSVIFLGFTVSTGEGGILCLGQAGFAAAGAFVAGRLATEANLPLLLAGAIGVAAAMVCGIIIGLMGTRLDQIGFALVTLAFALFCEKFVFNVQSIVPLSGVLYPEFKIFGLRSTQSAILLGAVVFALVAALLTWARHGRFGRLCAAVRGNPIQGESIGINVRGARVAIFAVGSAIAGLGGVLVGIQQGAVGIFDFALLIGLLWLAVVVTVGVRGYRGALVAGLMFTIFPAAFSYVDISGIGQLPTVLFGLGAIGLAREPRGFLYEMEMRIRRKRSRPDTAELTPPVRGGAHRAVVGLPRGGGAMSAVAAEKALELKDVTVRFGGLTALREVSVDAAQGEIVGLIGPNGSGKTTLLNVVTGLVRPVAGQVRIGSTSCRRLSVHRRVHLGLARTFQRASLFADLSVRDHLTLAAEAKHIWRRTNAKQDEGHETVDIETMLRSDPWNLNLNWLVGGLPLGGTRAVELAMALVVPPRVLLLDEPLSGLDPIERDAFASTLRDIRTRLGVTVILVEHDVESVVRLADRLVVLDFGVKLADGPTSEILTNTKVHEAYFGSGELV